MGNNPYFDLEIPAQDEGWWASVLEDEESHGGVPGARSTQSEDQDRGVLDWDRAMELFTRDEIIVLAVTGFNRGGLLVEGDRLYGFVPCSHLVDLPASTGLDLRDDCLSAYIDRKLQLKVIECVPGESRLVFSERAARAEAGKRTEIFNTLQPGDLVSGEVTNVTDFGGFVDLGGVEGLIHISELSWGRVAHPSQIIQVGQRVDVLVLDVAPERCRVALSLKRLFPNPWDSAEGRYPIDCVVPAEITALVPFGAFARLEEGLEGLIHTSEIPLAPGGDIKDLLQSGQRVNVRVLQVDVSRQRLGLSMRVDD